MSKGITDEEIKAALQVLQALAEVVRELKRVPSGELYARVMDRLSLQSYEAAIDRLVGTGLVRRDGNVLVWVEPATNS